ncbi:MAG TPA: o-succinylbenzoate synthase [Blastocatellia bacterium]|nr:o-succinylbenzoate synthase [Blastocatellia bacterium]
MINIPTTEIAIKRIALHRVRVPLREPFRISNGSVAEKDAILVEVTTGDGVTGWGEASPMAGSFYSADTPESTWAALRERLIPIALSQKSIDAPHFFFHLRAVPGEPFAKAGLEGALWDAHAQTLGVPLCELFGVTSHQVPSGVAIGIYDTIDELLERVGRYVAEGYQRVKIKIQPGWDVEPVAAVRRHFPNVPLMADANAAYTLKDIEVFRALDTCRLFMIEQPFARDAHDEAAELQRSIRTWLCADESADSIEAVRSLAAKRAARIVNLKVQRVGGLGEARLLLWEVLKWDLWCWVGTMPELGIASAQGLQLAMLYSYAYPTDIEASARWYVDDVIEPAITISGRGEITPPAGPGSGYAVDRAKVERYRIAFEEFRA